MRSKSRGKGFERFGAIASDFANYSTQTASDPKLREWRTGMRTATMLALAGEVSDTLHDLRLDEVPKQPPELPVLFEDIRRDMRKAEEAKSPNDTQKLTLRSFGTWREEVAIIEERNAALLEVLLMCLGALEECGDTAKAKRFRAWFAEHTTFTPYDDIAAHWENLPFIRRVARSVARCPDIMPTWLLNDHPMPEKQKGLAFQD